MEWLTITTSSCKAKKLIYSCMRTCNIFSLGECWVAKIPHFIHLSYTICHLIPILSFIKPLISTTLTIHMSLYYHFLNNLFWVFWVKLWLNINKINVFSLYLKVGWFWWWLQVYLNTLTRSKSPPSFKFKFHLQYVG